MFRWAKKSVPSKSMHPRHHLFTMEVQRARGDPHFSPDAIHVRGVVIGGLLTPCFWKLTTSPLLENTTQPNRDFTTQLEKFQLKAQKNSGWRLQFFPYDNWNGGFVTHFVPCQWNKEIFLLIAKPKKKFRLRQPFISWQNHTLDNKSAKTLH